MILVGKTCLDFEGSFVRNSPMQFYRLGGISLLEKGRNSFGHSLVVLALL